MSQKSSKITFLSKCFQRSLKLSKKVPKFSEDPLGYSKFKAAFEVEVDKKEVYDATEKLKFLLDAVEGSAKSCLATFMPG